MPDTIATTPAAAAAAPIPGPAAAAPDPAATAAPAAIETLADVPRARGWDSPRFESYDLATVTGNIGRRLAAHLPKDTALAFTSLQHEALNSPVFWGDPDSDLPPEHLIVQGATSAGKTLLSELAILDVLCRNGKALTLVPLKAMVRERAEHFARDMGQCAHEYRVFGSSSDFMDNDERLIDGDYDVGVLVYEKLFSMLNEPGNRLMDRCRLIVVDELSMLSKEERGPKLEVALEIVRRKSPGTRIMCLSTCDCSVENVARWLGQPAAANGADNPGEANRAADASVARGACPVIGSSERPLGLDEYLVGFDGSFYFRHIAGEQEPEAADSGSAGTDALRVAHARISRINTKGKLDVADPGKRARSGERKNRLLLALLKKAFADQPDARVLVFAGSRSAAAHYAHLIYRNLPDLFAGGPLDPALEARLRSCDADEDRQAMETLLRHGIAYHHAGVSTSLRELVEEEFGRNIRLVTATETLTVGINLPFDVMIMADFCVPRGEGEPVPISNQEYRNFIGRTGRLGQSNRCGMSYLIAGKTEDRDRYWDGLMESVAVDSALKDASPAECAPFYLGLLHASSLHAPSEEGFCAATIESMHARSFSAACGKRDPQADAILGQLEAARLCAENDFMAYGTTPIGQKLAPFALSTVTCRRILERFCSGKPGRSLPVGASAEDIAQDRYLLETLYQICQHPEVERLSMLRFDLKRHPESPSVVKNRLFEMMEERDGSGQPRHKLWNADGAAGFLSGLSGNTHTMVDGDKKAQRAMRAILMYYWTQGKTSAEIKRATGFDAITKINAGDLERMAEVIAYHLEAIGECVSISDVMVGNRSKTILEPDALREFRGLRARVRYGMPRELAVIAKRHVHGLDRSRILELGHAAAKAGYRPNEAIFVMPEADLERIMTRGQIDELRQRMPARYDVDKPEVLIRIMEEDLGGAFSALQEDALKAIVSWRLDAQYGLSDAVGALLSDAVPGHQLLRMPGLPAGCCAWRVTDGRPGGVLAEHRLAALTPGACAGALAQTLAQAPAGTRCLVVYNGDEQTDDGLQAFLEEYRGRGGNAQSLVVMEKDFFAFTLADALILAQGGNAAPGATGTDTAGAATSGAARALAAFLADAVGAFTLTDRHLFSLYNYLPYGADGNGGAPDLRLLCPRNAHAEQDSRYGASDLKKALEDNGLRVELATWGDAAEIAGGARRAPTLVFLDRSLIQRSRSLMQALDRLHKEECAGAGGTFALFPSAKSRTSWEAGNGAETRGLPQGQAWMPALCEIPHAVCETLEDAAREAGLFATTWQRPQFLVGVSYRHYDPGVCVSAPQGAAAETERAASADTEKLAELMSALAKRVGQNRILYDNFHQDLFNDAEARRTSLAAYRECCLYIVLGSVWTINSPACADELEIIRARVEREHTPCLVLRPRCGAVPVFGQEYTTDIGIDPDAFVQLVMDKLARAEACR